MKPKILFLVLDFNGEPWSSIFDNGCKVTWIPEVNEPALRYRGRNSGGYLKKKLNRLQISRLGITLWRESHVSHQLARRKLKSAVEKDSIIYLDLPDTWWRHGQKFLSALKYCYDNFEFDYLIRINSTVYVNYERLIGFLLANRPRYAGPLEKGKQFASGWGIILHRDMCKVLLNSDYLAFARFFDDEAIGHTLRQSGIQATGIEYIWAQSLGDVESINDQELGRYPFIRTKSYNIYGGRNDARIMNRVHQKLKYSQSIG